MGYPDFVSGDVLNASDMNAVGLWLVKSQTIGTGVSSVTVTGAFLAAYDNYRIICSGGISSATTNVLMQLTSITGTNYVQTGYFTTFGSTTLTGYASTATTFITGPSTATGYSWVMDIQNPFATLVKFGRTIGVSSANSYDFPFYIGNATSSSGFTLTPTTGTLTGGTIRVYGYRN
jgi:hypothetical protein